MTEEEAWDLIRREGWVPKKHKKAGETYHLVAEKIRYVGNIFVLKQMTRQQFISIFDERPVEKPQLAAQERAEMERAASHKHDPDLDKKIEEVKSLAEIFGWQGYLLTRSSGTYLCIKKYLYICASSRLAELTESGLLALLRGRSEVIPRYAPVPSDALLLIKALLKQEGYNCYTNSKGQSEWVVATRTVAGREESYSMGSLRKLSVLSPNKIVALLRKKVAEKTAQQFSDSPPLSCEPLLSIKTLLEQEGYRCNTQYQGKEVVASRVVDGKVVRYYLGMLSKLKDLSSDEIVALLRKKVAEKTAKHRPN